MKKTVEYIFFVIFIVAFFLTLFFFDILQRIAVPFGQKSVDWVVYYFNRGLILCLRIVGAKISVSYSDKLPETGPAIVISNHQSMFDIPYLHYGLQHMRPRFVSKIELGKGIPGVSTCLHVSHAALIDRSDPAQALAEIEKFSSFIKKEKVSGVIFPEGTRAKDGEFKPFKKRGVETLLKNTIPCWVVPVALDNSWKLQTRKYGPIPLGVNIKMNVGKPLYVSDPTQLKGIVDEIHAQIESSLNDLRSH